MGYQERKFTVEVSLDPVTNRIIAETWRDEHGRLDRPCDLPAVVMYDLATGLPETQQWYRKGLLHREGDKPADIGFDPTTGILTSERYAIMDELHREGDKPACIDRYADGTPAMLQYYCHGQKHREHGPALESFTPEGQPEAGEQEFWRHGRKMNQSDPTSTPAPRIP